MGCFLSFYGWTDGRSERVNIGAGAPPKNSVLNKFYIVFHLLSLCVFISIQNIGRSIHLNTSYWLSLNVFITTLDRYLSNAKKSGWQKQLFADGLQKSFFKSFAKFTGKHSCRSLFFSKVVGLTRRFQKRDSNRDVFLWNLRIFRKTFC